MPGEKEKSLLLVKPEVASQFAAIAADLDTENGWYLKVLKSKKVHLTDSVAWEFLKGCAPESFEATVADVTSGPCVVALVEHLDGGAVAKLQTAVGQLTGKYGDHFLCSSSTWAALREVNYFFPFVERLPVTTTFVLSATPSIAEQVKGRCWDEGLLVLAEGPVDSAAFGTLGVDAGDFGDAFGMLVEGRGAVEKVQLILGPAGRGVASTAAPGSIRAVLGNDFTGEYHGVYSSSTDDAAKYAAEQKLFEGKIAFEQTLLLVKPDAMENAGAILAKVEQANFTVLDKKTILLSEARAEAFYEADQGAGHFKSMVRHMTSAPICVAVVGRTAAVAALNQLCGPVNPRSAKATQPTSLRAVYGRHLQRNAVHASASAKDARHEVAFFFPHVVRNPLPDREETQDFLLRKSVAARAKLTEVQAGIGFDIEPSLLQFVSSGLVSLCQQRPHGDMKNLDALQYLADWLQENNPNNPKLDEPAVEIPVGVAPQTNVEGVAFTIEEPAEDVAGPEVVEIDVSQEKTDKFMAEFETPPMVLLAIGGADVLPDVAEKGGFMLLDVNELVAEEGKSGGRGAIGKEIARKLAGGMEVDIKLKLPLLRYQMLENADIGRFIISGLNTAQEMILFEQEVTEATIVLCAASAETEVDLIQSDSVKKIGEYYTPTGKYRTVESAPDRVQAAVTMMLPKVLYLLGASGSGKAAIAEQLELEYGYCHINVPSLLKKLAKEPTATGKSVAASIQAGELVDKAIVGPEIVDQMRGARRFGFTTFVLCGFPRSVEQLRFFESQIECVSEALVVEYPRADVVELALAQNAGRGLALTQDVVEKTVGAFYGADTKAVVDAFKQGPCAQVQTVALTLQTSPKQAWSAVTPLIRPRVTVIMGPPGSQDLKAFAALYASNQPQATLMDVDALLDSELERRTEIGVQMANMLARGQVIPVRMILEVVKKACRWTNSPALVMEKFPRFLDEAELLSQHFTVDRVILAEVSEAKHLAVQEAEGLTADQYAERWNRTLQVAQYFGASGLLVKVEMEDVKGKASSTELAFQQASKAARPKCIAIVGMPFVGTTDLANLMSSRNGFAVIGKDVAAGDPKETVAKIEEQLASTTASIVVLDDLLTDHDTYVAFEEAFGAPTVLYLTCSDEALAARAADAMKDNDDTEVQPILDDAKAKLEPKEHYLNQGLPNVYVLKAEPPEGSEMPKEELFAGVTDAATQKLQPQVHVVVGPSVRDASLTLATVLAQKAAGKQVILDAKELATPSPKYSSDLNAALQNAKACGEPLLPDVWAQVFAQRMPEFPLQHLFLVNFPTGGVSTFPTVRDELEVLSQYAVLKGIIVAEFSEAALAKYCYKGVPKAPATAGEALALFQGAPVSDAQAYTSELALHSAYLDALNMDRPKWLTPMAISGTSGTLAEVAQEAAKSVLAALDLA